MNKTIYALLFAVLFTCSARADRITASIQVTGTAAAGNTITVNGVVRTWANPVTVAATQIQTTNSVNTSATNLFEQIAANQYSTAILPSYGAADTVKLVGNSGTALAVSVAGGWATVTMSTQLTSAMIEFRLPMAAEATDYQRTNLSSLALKAINDYATNAFAAGIVPFSNYMALTTTQVVSGGKLFTAANTHSNSAQQWIGGVVSNTTVYANGPNVFSNAAQVIVGGSATGLALVNIPSMSGTLGKLTNGTFTNPTFTNGQNFGNPFRSPGGGSGSEQFGTSANAAVDFSLALGPLTSVQSVSGISVGNNAIVYLNSPGAIALGATTQIVDNSPNGIAIGQNATLNGNTTNSMAIGGNASVPFGYVASAAIGNGAVPTQSHQLRMGTGAEYVSIPGGLQVEGSISNSTFSGVNNWTGDLAYVRKNNTSLANGNNAAVDCSTNIYVKLSGPTGAFTINGIAGGRDGRLLVLQNSTGFTLTIANASGTDPTPANRILTNTGADVSNASTIGTVILIYDAGVSRWILLNSN